MGLQQKLRWLGHVERKAEDYAAGPNENKEDGSTTPNRENAEEDEEE